MKVNVVVGKLSCKWRISANAVGAAFFFREQGRRGTEIRTGGVSSGLSLAGPTDWEQVARELAVRASILRVVRESKKGDGGNVTLAHDEWRILGDRNSEDSDSGTLSTF